MEIEHFNVNNIPAVLYGGAAERVCLLIHGRGRNKKKAESLAEILCPRGFQVLGIDLPEHGERKHGSAKLTPWVAAPVLL